MSKGYLYDTGDELITRDGNPEFPDLASASYGDSVIVGKDGDLAIKKGNIVIPVSYNVSNKRLSFPEGVTAKDFKDMVAAGGDVYFVFRCQETTSYTRYPVGNVVKVSFMAGATGTTPNLSFNRVLVSLTVSESTATSVYISYISELSSISDTATYITISDASILTLSSSVVS